MVRRVKSKTVILATGARWRKSVFQEKKSLKIKV